MIAPTTFPRAQSGEELISAAVQIVKSNFGSLMRIAMLGAFPGIVAQLFLRSGGVATGIGVLLAIGGIVITGTIAIGALIQAISDVYTGHALDVEEALRVGRKVFRDLVPVRITTMFLIALGFVLLIVPGLILFARFFVADVIVVLEGKTKVGEVLDRSSELSQEARLRILGWLGIWSIAYLVVSVPFRMIVGWMTGSVIFASILAQIIIGLPLMLVFLTLMTLQYYDARFRKEAV